MLFNRKGKNLAIWLLLIAILAPVAIAQGSKTRPVKVYVMVGQSNMEGYGTVGGNKPGTLATIVKKEKEELYKFVADADGDWIERDDVWIHFDKGSRKIQHSGLKPGYGASNGFIGPELAFGHKMGDKHSEQVLIVKTSWGGKSLGKDFLPPTMKDYPRPPSPGKTGFYYQEVLDLVKDATENITKYFPDYAGQGFELAGLCFHQGWNDQYGGLSDDYEKNLVGFIKAIRSKEYGLNVPNLPIVIAHSGMINDKGEGLAIKNAQLAMADTAKYPEFAGNVSVIDTSKPYGPNKLQFKFPAEESPRNQGFHWNGNARTHLNLGLAMAAEMKKSEQPKLPSRLVAVSTEDGINLGWQYGSLKPVELQISRNGKKLNTPALSSKSTWMDTTALPGKHSYQVIITLEGNKKHTLEVTCDTSPTNIRAYRSKVGVTLTWTKNGKYSGYMLARGNEIISKDIAGDITEFVDEKAPDRGRIQYSLKTLKGDVKPINTTISFEPADAGAALVYEPFDYPADDSQRLSLIGKSGAKGTTGAYTVLAESKKDRETAMVPHSLERGKLSTAGNSASLHKWYKGTYIDLDDSIQRAGLLKDGETLWFSVVFRHDGSNNLPPADITLRTEDMKEGVGLGFTGKEQRTTWVIDGKIKNRRIGGFGSGQNRLVVGKFVWGEDGAEDGVFPYLPGPNLEFPSNHSRPSGPFKIDQSKLKRLVFQGGHVGSFIDEIRIGATYESVVGLKPATQ